MNKHPVERMIRATELLRGALLEIGCSDKVQIVLQSPGDLETAGTEMSNYFRPHIRRANGSTVAQLTLNGFVFKAP